MCLIISTSLLSLFSFLDFPFIILEKLTDLGGAGHTNQSAHHPNPD